MSIIKPMFPTLKDVANVTGADKKILAVVEVLNQQNEILEDAVFIEANDGTAHKSAIRSGIPDGTWRKLNYGVKQKKTGTVPVRDTCGMLENYAEVDKALADLNGNTAEFRATEDVAYIEGMNQNAASTIFYGNTDVNPERFMGVTPRYSSKTAENKSHVIDAGGTGAKLTSIWLIGWGPSTVHMIYPKGSQAGLQVTDLKEQTLFDDNGGKYQGYRSHYKWDLGLVVKDWRYAVRICNIDLDTLTKDAATGADLVDLMTDAVELLPNPGNCKPVFYMHRTLRSFLRKQVKNAKNVHLTLEQVAGKKVLFFDEFPVRRTDALVTNEERVV